MNKDRKARGSSPNRRSEQRADADVPTDLKSCPVCGCMMREHSILRDAHDTILNCPVPHPGAWDRDAFEPVNEFGMVLRTRDSVDSDEQSGHPR